MKDLGIISITKAGSTSKFNTKVITYLTWDIVADLGNERVLRLFKTGEVIYTSSISKDIERLTLIVDVTRKRECCIVSDIDPDETVYITPLMWQCKGQQASTTIQNYVNDQNIKFGMGIEELEKMLVPANPESNVIIAEHGFMEDAYGNQMLSEQDVFILYDSEIQKILTPEQLDQVVSTGAASFSSNNKFYFVPLSVQQTYETNLNFLKWSTRRIHETSFKNHIGDMLNVARKSEFDICRRDREYMGVVVDIFGNVGERIFEFSYGELGLTDRDIEILVKERHITIGGHQYALLFRRVTEENPLYTELEKALSTLVMVIDKLKYSLIPLTNEEYASIINHMLNFYTNGADWRLLNKSGDNNT